MSKDSISHLVWDWNGTIFNDTGALIKATIDAFVTMGLPTVTTEAYQRYHTQPIPLFYERLAGRSLSANEQHNLDVAFRTAYAKHSQGSTLTLDARSALTMWQESGGSNSLLSMYPLAKLLPLVRGAEIDDLFACIDSPEEAGHPLKSPFLRQHLERVGISSRKVLLIGDSVDDVRAARECGIECIVYYSGTVALHALEHFTELNVPIVNSLTAAAALAYNGRVTTSLYAT